MMYFGTKDNMRWVKSPAVNTPLGLNTQTDSGTDVNGGGYVLTGAASHKVFDFSWGAAPASDVYAITDYATGDFGRGPIYFLDEFALTTNVFPQDFTSPVSMWRSGRMTPNADKPAQLNNPVKFGPNPLNIPDITPHHNINGVAISDEVFIPVPTGYRLWVAYVAGTSADTLKYRYVDSDDQSVSWLTVTATSLPSGPNPTAPTSWSWYSFSGDQTFRWEVGGFRGGTVGALVGVILPVGETPSPTHRWTSGKGNGGCKFDGPPTITGISAMLTNSVSASARLREVF